jgi:uncharacterized protein YjiS (DUF1127 family)
MERQSQCLDLPVTTPSHVSLRRLLGEALRNLWRSVKIWNARYRQRRELLALSDTMLKDIGITRAQADHEGGKAFWE